MSATLESGQTVEIIRAPAAQPNPAWLAFVITGKARSSIRQALKHQQTSESQGLGKRLLERALELHDKTFDDLDEAKISNILVERNIDCFDNLLVEIGLGNQMAGVIVRHLLGDTTETDIQENHGPLAIKGTEGLVVTYLSLIHI